MLILFPCLSLWAPLWGADFGLILDQTAGYGGPDTSEGEDASEGSASEGSGAFDYAGALIPRFSVMGETGGFYISASVKADKKSDITYVPELLRTEFSWDFDSGEFRLGRMPYVDPLGIIANGLFDGAYVSLDMGEGSASLGAWYTGLLYNERANITMSAADTELYNIPVDYENFTDTYFAPRRIVAALGWRHLSLAELMQVQFTFLDQIDLAKENKLNSQYLAAKISVPVNSLVLSLGGCLEMIEDANDEMKMALEGELGIAWMFTESRLSLSGRYSSGVAEDGSLTAFKPLSTVYQGEILKAKLSGLSVASLDYLSRLHRTLSAGLTASCFMRSDLGTYNGYPITADSGDGYILGTELFGRLMWSPVSDIQINLGAGSFLPSLGDTAPDADSRWRVELNLILAFF